MSFRIWAGVVLVGVALSAGGCGGPRRQYVEKYNQEGLILLEEGKLSDALGAFRASLKWNPEHHETLYYAGYTCRRIAQKRMDERDLVGAESSIDDAIHYFRSSIHARPAYQRSIDALAEAEKVKRELVERRTPRPVLQPG